MLRLSKGCRLRYRRSGDETGRNTRCQLLGNWKLVVCCFTENVFDIRLKFIIQQHVHKHTSRVRDGTQMGCPIEKQKTTKHCLDVQVSLKISYSPWDFLYVLFIFLYLWSWQCDLYLINMHYIIKQHQACAEFSIRHDLLIYGNSVKTDIIQDE